METGETACDGAAAAKLTDGEDSSDGTNMTVISKSPRTY